MTCQQVESLAPEGEAGVQGEFPSQHPTKPPEGRQQEQEELQFCRLWNKNHIHRKIDEMKRKRAMYQMKEQDKTPENQLNEVATFQKKNSE